MNITLIVNSLFTCWCSSSACIVSLNMVGSVFEWSYMWMLRSPMIIRLSSLDIFSISSSVMSPMNMSFAVLSFTLAGGRYSPRIYTSLCLMITFQISYSMVYMWPLFHWMILYCFLYIIATFLPFCHQVCCVLVYHGYPVLKSD